MKKVAIFALAGMLGTAVQAGNLEDPVVEPTVIAEAAAESSAPSAALVLGLTALTLFVTAASK
ncbi:hypothetical protein [Aestuariicoccus sp. MJ-SS9]|uniref:hypothetical protein n=1 Tax=Aestuariicoccus sp. MJ-SS9 TaxID=3079855 RepID=UPI00290D83D4|nr:hypothetical protein [Aestuariicoccus sp. MJ-SS9]MDU8913367.1 hypothetical protein [Aestuariicoccus sp. MJ-SS9]